MGYREKKLREVRSAIEKYDRGICSRNIFTYTVKDDRKEIMRQGGMRNVAARVYYPVLRESVKGLTKAVALSDNMLKGLKDTFKVVPDFRKNPESNLTECYLNANRIPGKKFPLIMFNHAYNSYREGNHQES